MEKKETAQKEEENEENGNVKIKFEPLSAPGKKNSERCYKKLKTVNWEGFKLDDDELLEHAPKKSKDDSNKHEVKFKKPQTIKIQGSEPINDGEYIEIEVIEGDGKVNKQYYNKKRLERKEFLAKRIKNRHDEYTKAKEFFKSHQNEE